MNCEVSEIAADVYRLSTFHPEYGIQFNQFLIKDEEPFLMHTGFRKLFPVTRESLLQGLQGPLSKDMPYTPDTEKTLHRLADLAPQTLATMHGSSYRGDGGKAINELTEVIREVPGGPAESS